MKEHINIEEVFSTFVWLSRCNWHNEFLVKAIRLENSSFHLYFVACPSAVLYSVPGCCFFNC